MNYTKKVLAPGDPGRSLDFLRQQLALQDYRVTEAGEGSLSATFSGFMQKNRPPLAGASRITVSADSESLALGADYGNLRRTLRLFWLIFPVGFTALFVVLMSVIPGMPGPLFGLVTALPMTFVPVMTRLISVQRIGADLDHLLSNAAAAGGYPDVWVPPTRPPFSLGSWLLLALACVAGCGVTGYAMISTLFEAGQALARVVAPGTGEFTLEHGGQYTIFHEYRGAIDGVAYARPPDLSDMAVSLRDAESGVLVTLEPAKVGTRYSYGERAGFSTLQFTVDAPGRFVLEGKSIRGEAPRTVLAISPWDTDRVFLGFGLNLGVFVLGILAAITCLIMAWYSLPTGVPARG